MADLTKWRIYCETEKIWSEGWIETSSGKPTKCFNETSHNINTESQQKLDSTGILNVRIKQEYTATGGNYKCAGYHFDIPKESTGVYSVSWEYPVTVMCVHVQNNSNDLGDSFDVVVAPKTVIGATTSYVGIGVDFFSVSSSVINNCVVGYECFIGDFFLGRILKKDTSNLTIKTEYKTILPYISGSLISFQMRIVENLDLGYSSGFKVGSTSISGKHLPANTATNVIYKNRGSEKKRCNFIVEFLY